MIAEYDIAMRRMTYVNAGHNPPILRRKDGALEKLEVGGLPLGIDADLAYQQCTRRLAAGDSKRGSDGI